MLVALVVDMSTTRTASLYPYRHIKLQINGELVVWDPDRGRISFAQLQRRLTAGNRLPQLAAQYPATLVAFDLLQTAHGRSLLDQPLAHRRAQLAELLAEVPSQ